MELSKVLMWKFHYDFIKNKWKNKLKPLFTDTDSLMYEIETDDVFDVTDDVSDDVSAAIKKCLISVIIELSQNTAMMQKN